MRRGRGGVCCTSGRGRKFITCFNEIDVNEGDHFEELRIGIDEKIMLKRVLKQGGKV